MLEQLELEPQVQAGFSPRPSPSYGGRGLDQGLRFWSRSPEGAGFLSVVMAASAVVRGGWALRLGSAFLCLVSFYPSVDVPWLEAGLGLEGL